MFSMKPNASMEAKDLALKKSTREDNDAKVDREFVQAYSDFKEKHAEQFKAVQRIEKFLIRRFGLEVAKENSPSAPTLSPAEALHLVIRLEALPLSASKEVIQEILKPYLERNPDHLEKKIEELKTRCIEATEKADRESQKAELEREEGLLQRKKVEEEKLRGEETKKRADALEYELQALRAEIVSHSSNQTEAASASLRLDNRTCTPSKGEKRKTPESMISPEEKESFFSDEPENKKLKL